MGTEPQRQAGTPFRCPHCGKENRVVGWYERRGAFDKPEENLVVCWSCKKPFTPKPEVGKL